MGAPNFLLALGTIKPCYALVHMRNKYRYRRGISKAGGNAIYH